MTDSNFYGLKLLSHIKYPITLWPFYTSLILFCMLMVNGWLNFIIQTCLCHVHVNLVPFQRKSQKNFPISGCALVLYLLINYKDLFNLIVKQAIKILYNELCHVIDLNTSIVMNSLSFTNKVANALLVVI